MLSKISRRIVLIVVSVLAFTNTSQAQEINATVTVVTKPNIQVTTVDKENIDALQRVIQEFLNNTKWTTDLFEAQERINCSFQLTLEEINNSTNFRASLIVSANRPIFNASISSSMINFKDDFVNFTFNRDQIMQYSENQFRDNLTSTFAFWVYMILGYDYDSFSKEGGTKFFTLAQQIVTLAQATGGPGWSQNEPSKRNRFFIIDNLLNPVFQPLRQAYYDYHRNGVDMLYSDIVTARKNILNALKSLEAVQNARFGNVNLQIFTLAKRDEFINIFSKAEAGEKTEVVAILKKLDPSNGEKYDEILKM